MDDQVPQWPFMPAIQGQVPTPRPDPRQDKSLAFARALMATKAPIPMPRPDPRDWAHRAVPNGEGTGEENTMGAIHPDSFMKSQGIPAGSGVDPNTYTQPGIDSIILNNIQGKQRPLGMPPPTWQQNAGNGLFGIPTQHLQQMAAAKPPDQNLPKLPQSGFIPSLSPMYMNDTHPLSKAPASNQPPIFWQPG